MPQRVEPNPTQRYDLAPQAPSYATRQQPQPQQQPSPFAAQQHTGNTSQLFNSYSSQPLRKEVSQSPFDIATILLAILAFFAVACLIPLFIAVFQARLGG